MWQNHIGWCKLTCQIPFVRSISLIMITASVTLPVSTHSVHTFATIYSKNLLSSNNVYKFLLTQPLSQIVPVFKLCTMESDPFQIQNELQALYVMFVCVTLACCGIVILFHIVHIHNLTIAVTIGALCIHNIYCIHYIILILTTL